jgi:hypothetical protein
MQEAMVGKGRGTRSEGEVFTTKEGDEEDEEDWREDEHERQEQVDEVEKEESNDEFKTR